jgi:signal peptidase II
MPKSAGNRSLFWFLLIGVLVLDLGTKSLAVRHLSPIPQPVLGDFLHWQLVYNPGAAFGLNAGPSGRWLFAGLSALVLTGLGFVVRTTAVNDHRRLFALSLICGGAAGNLIDRIRNPRGVVDFIDIQFLGLRLPTFNIADVALVSGVAFLAKILFQETDPNTAGTGS